MLCLGCRFKIIRLAVHCSTPGTLFVPRHGSAAWVLKIGATRTLFDLATTSGATARVSLRLLDNTLSQDEKAAEDKMRKRARRAARNGALDSAKEDKKAAKRERIAREVRTGGDGEQEEAEAKAKA